MTESSTPEPDVDETCRSFGTDLRASPGQISALLASVAILVLGNGLQGTLLGVRAGLDGMAEESIGLIMSAYFVGFAVGSVFSPYLIERVGHIRTFAALASLASAVALAYLFLISPLSWSILRIAHGMCYAGLIVVAESWLNAGTDRKRRGRVLAIYGVVVMAAWAASQPLLIIASPSGFLLFCLVSICLSLALVPVTLSRAGVPGVVTAARSNLKRLFEISPLGIVGVFMVGLWTSAFWGMGPTFAQSSGLNDAEISAFMAITMAGALVFQWPLGWLSDVIDRRYVILAACLVAGVLSAALAYNPGLGLVPLLGLSFLYGSASITLYSICVAHVNDQIDQNELVAAASGLVLVYAVGSIGGPILASLFMREVGPEGFFLFSAVVQGIYVAFCLLRIVSGSAIAKTTKEDFVAMPGPGTSHAALPLHKHGSKKVEGEPAPR